MKTDFSKHIAFLLVLTGLISCNKQSLEKPEEEIKVVESINPESEEDFFYHFDEKIFFQQSTEQILLKSAPNIHWSQITPLLNDPAFTVSVALWTEKTPIFLLQANDEKPIPPATFESYVAIPEIVSVSYMYRYINGTYFVIQGAHTDEFAVKLKGTTSFAQLQALARQNDCTVGNEDPFVENQYNLYIPETSGSDIIQISKLFYETGLFEFSSPNFHVISGHPLSQQTPTPFFYYYYGVKMYLQQATDKISLKFASDASMAQIQDIIKSDVSLKPFDEGWESLRVAVLETKNGKPVPLATVESFKARPEVVSASYMFRFDNSQGIMGFTDEISVKLKGTTSYEQLQELAVKNNCTVEIKNQTNQFTLYVSKTSDLDALQTSNSLFETGLFEWSEPNSFSIGNWHVLAPLKRSKPKPVNKLKTFFTEFGSGRG